MDGRAQANAAESLSVVRWAGAHSHIDALLASTETSLVVKDADRVFLLHAGGVLGGSLLLADSQSFNHVDGAHDLEGSVLKGGSHGHMGSLSAFTAVALANLSEGSVGNSSQGGHL